jgi:hypothetical protein
MGPQEKRLTSELAIYLIRSCVRAMQKLPPGETLELGDRRRWFEQAYREWQLTPRVDLAGRSPYEVIAAERAASRVNSQPRRVKPSIEIYTDLPTPEHEPPANRASAATREGAAAQPVTEPEPRRADDATRGAWQRLANQLFGSWLDDELNQL